MPIDPAKYTTRLQAAADRLCAGRPDRVTVWLDAKGQIKWRCRTWSAAMTRTTFCDTIALAEARKLIPKGTTGTSRRAFLMMKALLDDGLAIQANRHAAAKALGLLAGCPRFDLESARVLVDRQQKATLLADGIDLHAAIIAMGKHSRWRGRGVSSVLRAHLDVFEPQVAMLMIEQKGAAPPVLSAWQQISRHAFYCGDTLDLDIPVPEIIAIAAAGRRLGDVVATGSPELDDRRIECITTKPAHAIIPRYWTVTKIGLEPDLVEVGPRLVDWCVLHGTG